MIHGVNTKKPGVSAIKEVAQTIYKTMKKKKRIHPLGKLGQPQGRFNTLLKPEVRVKFGHAEIDKGHS